MRKTKIFKDYWAYREFMSDFGCREWFSFLPLFSIYVILGLYVLFTTSVLAGYFYLGYVIFVYMGMIMLVFCTKCPHYGQRCSYIFAGHLAQKLFTQREGDYKFWERVFPVIAFVILLAFPLLFVLNRPLYLLSFGVIIILIAFVKPFIVCAACENTDCWGKTISQAVRRNKW